MCKHHNANHTWIMPGEVSVSEFTVLGTGNTLHILVPEELIASKSFKKHTESTRTDTDLLDWTVAVNDTNTLSIL